MPEPSPPAQYGPRSRTAQAIAGVFIAAMGVFLGWLFWTLPARTGMFSPVGPFLAAGFVALGLGLILFGGYREERLRRGESLEGLEGLRLLTPRWWGVLAAWLLFGVAYAALWRGGIVP